MYRDGTSPRGRGFQIHAADNVATVIDDAAAGAEVTIFGPAPVKRLVAAEAIAGGHKIALAACAPGDAIRKFGVPIGHATQSITPGAWVHLHNCASDYDARSSSLDLHSGAPTDQTDAYV